MIIKFFIMLVILSISYSEAATWQDSIVIPETPNDVLKVEMSDVDCLALNIYHEARGERALGHALVAQVTMNRIRDLHYPNTACGVVLLQRRSAKTGNMVPHFSWTLDGASDSASDKPIFKEAYLMAIEYLFMGKTAPVQGANDLLSYHADWVSPEWHDMEFVFKYDSHIFYKRRNS